MRRKNIITVLVIVMSLSLIRIALGKTVMLDMKLGIYGIQDTVGEKIHIGIPEIASGFWYLVKDNIITGLELDYFLLPDNYNLWGNTIDTKVKVFKEYINIGWYRVEGERFRGVVFGYNFGMNILGNLVGGYKVREESSMKLMYMRKDKLIGYDIGIENTPGLRIFGRLGILIEITKRDKNKK
jgi:hypothetical protein